MHEKMLYYHENNRIQICKVSYQTYLGLTPIATVTVANSSPKDPEREKSDKKDKVLKRKKLLQFAQRKFLPAATGSFTLNNALQSEVKIHHLCSNHLAINW